MCLFSLPSRNMKKGMVIQKAFEEGREKPLQSQSRREITNIPDPCPRRHISEAKQCGGIGIYAS